MNTLSAILQEHIGDSTTGVVFGRKEAASSAPAHVDVDRLITRLDGQSRFNNRLIVSVVAAYLAVVATTVVLVVIHHNAVQWILAALGGNLLTLAGSAGFIRNLWREKNYMDMLLALLPSLTAAEALKMLRALYFEKVAGEAHPATARAVTAPSR